MTNVGVAENMSREEGEEDTQLMQSFHFGRVLINLRNMHFGQNKSIQV